MIGNLFSIRYVSIQTQDWADKKPQLVKMIREEEFEQFGVGKFETDRHSNGNRYIGGFCELFNEELNEFGMEMGFTALKVGSIWSVRYSRGDYHAVHNHRSTGYSGILYLEYDEKVHQPSIHIAPWNDPVADTTQFSAPSVKEGTFIFVPSSVLHFTRPNESDKLRQIVAFDMEVQ